MNRPLSLNILSCGLPLVLVLTGLTEARAGQLEAKLLEKAPEILDHMRSQKKCGTLGVLKGRIYKDGRYSDSIGTLNFKFARRLEMALVLGYRPAKDKDITVLADATLVAAKLPGASHLTAKGIARLFDGEYTPRWGNPGGVKADGFVAGTLLFSEDMRTLTVKILAIVPGDAKPSKILDFTVETDLQVLLESGESFSLRGGLGKDRTLEEINEEARKDVKEQKLVAEVKKPVVLRDKSEQVVAIDIYYLRKGEADRVRGVDDLSAVRARKATIELRNKRAEIEEPSEDECVHLVLRRVDHDIGKIGVVIMVNGQSLINEDTRTPEQCRMFVLEKGVKAMLLRGYFYDADPSNKKWRQFRVLSAQDSKEAEVNYGPEVGQIGRAHV